MDESTEKFSKKQEEVLINLDKLLFNLNICTDAGMIDRDDALYNRIEDLVEEVKIIDTLEELEEFTTQAKTLESQIDLWLISQGETTVGLEWPSF